MRRAKSDQTKPPSPSRDSRRGTVIHLKKMQRKKFNATNSKNIPTEEADALDDQEVRLTKEDIKQASIKRMALHDIKTLKVIIYRENLFIARDERSRNYIWGFRGKDEYKFPNNFISFIQSS